MDAAGDFVVAWQSLDQDGTASYGIYARMFNGSGTATATELPVNTTPPVTRSSRRSPWMRPATSSSPGRATARTADGYGVYAQRFDGSGVRPGAASCRSTAYTTGAQFTPAVAMDAAGDFVGRLEQFRPGRQRLRHLRAAVYGRGGHDRRGDSAQRLHGQRPGQPRDRHGRDRRLRRRLGRQERRRYQRRHRPPLPGDRPDPVFLRRHVPAHRRDRRRGQPQPARLRLRRRRPGLDRRAGLRHHQHLRRHGPGVDHHPARHRRQPGQQPGLGLRLRRPRPTRLPDRPGGQHHDDGLRRPGQPGPDQRPDHPDRLRRRPDQHDHGQRSERPRVASDAAGDFVVVWRSLRPGRQRLRHLRPAVQRSASPRGASSRSTPTTTGDQFAPAVAMDAAGDFVVAWNSDASQDGSNYGVYAQRYNAAGVAQGGEFQVNTYTTSSQACPAVAMDAAGDFVVAWQSYGQDGSGYGVYAQRYNAAGTAQGSEFRVNTYTTNAQRFPTVAMDAAGDFVVAWAARRPGRQQLRRLRPAVRRRRDRPGERVPGQHLHHRVSNPCPRSRWTRPATSSSPGRATTARTAATTASTPSATMPPASPRGASSRSTPTRPASS